MTDNTSAAGSSNLSRLQILLLLGAATLSGGCGIGIFNTSVNVDPPAPAPSTAPAPATTSADMTDKGGDNGKGQNASYY